MKYLLDTNICIYIIKKHPIQVINQLRTHSIGDIAISSITVAELEYGAAKSKQPEKNKGALINFVSPLEIISFDYRAAIHYGDIRAHLERLGQVIGSLDMLIAAHARSIPLTLVTNNIGEFSRIPNLLLENWATIDDIF